MKKSAMNKFGIGMVGLIGFGMAIVTSAFAIEPVNNAQFNVMPGELELKSLTP